MRILFSIIFSVWCFSAAANIGGSDLQNFNPTTNGLDFVSVHSSNVLSSGEFNFGSFINFTTNSLAYATINAAPSNQSFAEPNDKLLYSNLHFGVGLLQGWDFGISAGFINSQTIEQDNFLFAYGDTGINDFRINTKVRWFKSNGVGIATIATIDFDQIKNNPFVGDNAGPMINLEAALDYEISSDLLVAGNFGYRIRVPGTAIPNRGVTPLPDQWLYSGALSYNTDSYGSAVIAEIYGSYPVEITTTPTDRQISNLELLLGYNWKGLENIDLHGGVGTEVYHGLGSPDFRVYAGLNWRLNFLDSPISSDRTPIVDTDDVDNDGVPNPIDQCNDSSPGENIGEDGCQKELGQQSEGAPSGAIFIDADNDGVSDDKDKCPQTPPTARVNSFGCEIQFDTSE